MSANPITCSPALSDVLTPEALLRLSAAFGGEIIYCPSPEGSACPTSDRLEALLGEEAEAFFAAFATQTLAIPSLEGVSGRASLKVRAAALLQQGGFAIADIARVMGQPRSTVRGWLNESAH